ncbi:SprT family zinc-dependent metalloprotease [Castellaniella sp.]|uniref:M48 family metallopeptidase n=1 Tax=Castellaniella sp. TaxID=1955812 RepID=UPI002AFDFE7E|nr:SprT family zinc-dependent metalloprotease [Castellaniella sp.]
MNQNTETSRQLDLFDTAPFTAKTGASKRPPVAVQPAANALPAYVLRRSRRKTIGLTLRDAQLHVQAPTWVTRRQIEDVIREKNSWIQKKLAIQQERLSLLALQNTQWRNGGRIPYLGTMIRLALDSTAQTHFDDSIDLPETGRVLTLALPDSADSARIQDLTQAWLQAQATRRFKQRLQHYLDLAGQQIRSWGLSGAQGRWGSCSGQRRIRLNWRLIHLPPDLIDYVIAHEVAHLKEMNHSPAFWREVACLYPDYKQARDTLKQHHPATLPLF